jgi:hypothetical protein
MQVGRCCTSSLVYYVNSISVYWKTGGYVNGLELKYDELERIRVAGVEVVEVGVDE